jgi:glyoxylase-like metal-dependent hydrolase (beta-lactamase superfamily II)
VVFSHHHPDHTLNAALFPNARFHDHWAIYHRDSWHWRDAEGYQLTRAIKLIRTPGHTLEDITTLAGTPQGVVAFTHLWNDAAAAGDRHAVDLAALHAGRRRVLAIADLIVPATAPPSHPTPQPRPSHLAGRPTQDLAGQQKQGHVAAPIPRVMAAHARRRPAATRGHKPGRAARHLVPRVGRLTR